MDDLLAALELRLAVPADAAPIAAMSRELIETGLGWSWTKYRVQRAIAGRDTSVLSAVLDNELIGFGIMDFGDETAHLSLFAVQTRYQRHGIGRRLFEWLRQSALTAGIAIIRLELRASNTAAQSFYRSLGFEVTGRAAGYYRGRETALRMALQLRQHLRGRPHEAF